MSEDVVISTSPFDWCNTDQHEQCARKYERTYSDGKNGIVHTGVIVRCGYKKRSCKCYVKPADRPKAKKTRRKA